MSITLSTEDQVFNTLISLLQVQFPAQDLSDRSFLGRAARMVAQSIVLFERAVEQADNDAVPAFKQDADGTVLSKCSGAALDAWAITYGLPSGVPGIFGRKVAIGSSGGAGTPACSVGGTVIPAGTQLVNASGTITVQTTTAITTDGPPNTVAVDLISVSTGAAANLAVGTVLTFTAPPVGVSANLTLTRGLSGGADREEDGALLARLLFRIQNPPRGGTAADYRYWAESSTDAARNNATNGIVRAYVYPLRSGVGSVDVIALVAGTGAARNPTPAVRGAVANYLNSVRPVTATVNVLAAANYNPLRFRVRPRPNPKYAFDWADGGSATIIQAVGASTITVAGAPAALVAAVAAGAKPRVQIINTTSGATAVPYQARVLSIVLAAPDILTLDVMPSPAPQVGDIFYAGGPVVDPIAAGLQAFVDTLGPARASGYADPNDAWTSDVTLARLADVTMEVRDSDGTRMVDNIPNLATTGVLIAPGAGAFAPSDYQAIDAFGGIELCRLRTGGIEVVQGL